MTTQAQSQVPNATGMGRFVPILSIGLLFFIFGFITWLNGALIPFLQMVCELTEMQALLIAFCFYIAVLKRPSWHMLVLSKANCSMFRLIF